MKDNVKKMGNIYGFTGGSYAGNVYDSNGLCPAINTCGGGNREPMIIIKSELYERTSKKNT